MRAKDNKSLEDFDLHITKEFIAEGIKYAFAEHRKKGGPYNKNQRRHRRNEVFRLHFEYGYSAMKIAEMMKINRNTINNDINYLYDQLAKKWRHRYIESWWMKQMLRLESQRTRLLEQIKKKENFQNILAIERMILEIDNKIMHWSIKIITSDEYVTDRIVNRLNEYAKNKKMDLVFVKSRDISKLETKNRDKIRQIINNDRASKESRTVF